MELHWLRDQLPWMDREEWYVFGTSLAVAQLVHEAMPR